MNKSKDKFSGSYHQDKLESWYSDYKLIVVALLILIGLILTMIYVDWWDSHRTEPRIPLTGSVDNEHGLVLKGGKEYSLTATSCSFFIIRLEDERRGAEMVPDTNGNCVEEHIFTYEYSGKLSVTVVADDERENVHFELSSDETDFSDWDTWYTTKYSQETGEEAPDYSEGLTFFAYLCLGWLGFGVIMFMIGSAVHLRQESFMEKAKAKDEMLIQLSPDYHGDEEVADADAPGIYHEE